MVLLRSFSLGQTPSILESLLSAERYGVQESPEDENEFLIKLGILLRHSIRNNNKVKSLHFDSTSLQCIERVLVCSTFTVCTLILDLLDRELTYSNRSSI